MNILDIIIILCCCPILISGYKKGFINQAVSIIALLAGAWIASGLADTVGEWIRPMIEGKCDSPEQVAHIGGFALAFVAICTIFLLCGKLIEKLFLKVIPEWINKMLGLALAAANSIILFCTLYLVFEVLNKVYFFTDIKGEFFTDSTLFPIIESTAKTILPNLINSII